MRAAWDRELAKYENRNDAAAVGLSFVAVAEALGVSRQRVYNMIHGTAPISPALWQHLTPLLKLPPAPAVCLPRPKRTEQDILVYAREKQRTIQRLVVENKIDRVPPVVLEEKAQIAKWRKLVKLHGGKSAAIRQLIMDAEL